VGRGQAVVQTAGERFQGFLQGQTVVQEHGFRQRNQNRDAGIWKGTTLRNPEHKRADSGPNSHVH